MIAARLFLTGFLRDPGKGETQHNYRVVKSSYRSSASRAERDGLRNRNKFWKTKRLARTIEKWRRNG